MSTISWFTMFFVTLFLLFGFTASSIGAQRLYDVEKAHDLFQDFMVTFNKNYSSEAEKEIRLKIFTENLQHFNKLNSMHPDVFGINEFADLSDEEFINTHTGLIDAPYGFNSVCKRVFDRDVVTREAPESLDWRSFNAVTAVKNQGLCGSCWAFSAIANLESQYAIKYKTHVDLSEQQLVDCVIESNKCENGIIIAAMSHLVQHGGAEPESVYPYRGVNQSCSFNPDLVTVRPSSCENYILQNEDNIKEVLSKVGPLSVAIDASNFLGYDGQDIIFPCQSANLNHGVLLVGYGRDNTGQKYWILKNSWGPAWGAQGYIKIPRGVNACGIVSMNIASMFLA